jgi:hypothetical protein
MHNLHSKVLRFPAKEGQCRRKESCHRENNELASKLAKLPFTNNSHGEAANAMKIIISSQLPSERMIK